MYSADSLAGDESPDAVDGGSANRIGWEALKSRTVMTLPQKRKILLDVANLKPEHLFEPDQLAEGRAIFQRLMSDSESKRNSWQAYFVAEQILAIHNLLESSDEARTKRSATTKRRSAAVENLCKLVQDCKNKDTQEAAVGTGKKNKASIKFLGPKDNLRDGSAPPPYDMNFMNAIALGEKAAFSFPCPACTHTNCFPVRGTVQELALGAAAHVVFGDTSVAGDRALRVALRANEGAPPCLISQTNGLSVDQLRRHNKNGMLGSFNHQRTPANNGFLQDRSQ